MSAGGEPDLAITVTEQPGHWLVSVAGEVDMGNVAVLRANLGPLLERTPTTIVMELSGLRFMDSSALGVLVQANAKGATVRLRNPSPFVTTVLKASGLDQVLAVEE